MSKRLKLGLAVLIVVLSVLVAINVAYSVSPYAWWDNRLQDVFLFGPKGDMQPIVSDDIFIQEGPDRYYYTPKSYVQLELVEGKIYDEGITKFPTGECNWFEVDWGYGDVIFDVIYDAGDVGVLQRRIILTQKSNVDLNDYRESSTGYDPNMNTFENGTSDSYSGD